MRHLTLPPQHTTSELGEHLYQVMIQGPGKRSPVFVTAVEECPIPLSRTPLATTRQLLVGLDNLSLDGSEKIQLNARPATRTRARASLDDTPLILVVYTVRNQDCIRDYVTWYQSSPASMEYDQMVDAPIEALLGTLLAEESS